MVCGNAVGEVLPPYVNYKAEKMWDTWTEGGPANTRYNRSKSGWFDSCSFEDWFFSTVLPVLKKQDGRKVLLGDNLSSHINLKVLKACEDHNISFIALPPNSTHLTQPLDLAFFRPLKTHWRQILDEWKATPDGQRMPTVPKNIFPSLLKKLWVKLLVNAQANLQAGFKKAGIYPLCPTKVLERLPSYIDPNAPNPDTSLVSDAFIQYIETTRKRVLGQGEAIKRRKRKLEVPAGKSISAEEVEKLASPSTSKTVKFMNKKTKAKKQDSSSEEDENDQYSLASESSLNLSAGEDADEITDASVNAPTSGPTDGYLPQKEEFVVVAYEGEYWPGQVVSVEENGAHVKCMARSGRLWKWPDLEDCIFYTKDEIKFPIAKPNQVTSKRELYHVKEL